MTITHSAGTITIAADTAKASGTATSGTLTTLTDTGASFSGVVDHIVFIISGTAAGQTGYITAATSTVLTVRGFTVAPDNTSVYRVAYDFDDIAAADTTGTWGVFTAHQSGSSFEFGGNNLINNGFLADTACTVNCVSSNICFANNNAAGYQFGEWDSATDTTFNGVNFIYSDFSAARTSGRNWFFLSGGSGDQVIVSGAFYDCQFRLKPGQRYDVLIPSFIYSNLRFYFLDCVFTATGSGTQAFTRYLISSLNTDTFKFQRNKIWVDPSATSANTTFPSHISPPPTFEGLYTNLDIAINTVQTNGVIFLNGQFFNDRVGPRQGQAYFDNPVFDGFEYPTWYDPGSGTPAATTEIRVRYRYVLATAADAYLAVYDGTGAQVQYVQANGSGDVATLTLDRWQYIGASPSWSDRGPHDFYLAKYGTFPLEYQIDFTTAVHGGKDTQGSRPLLAYPFVVASAAAAAAITGVALGHSPALITISSSRTLQEVHDWLHYAKTLSANIDKPLGLLASSATRFACADYSLTVNAGVLLTSSGVTLDFSGPTLTLADAGDKTGLLATIGASSAVVVTNGTTDLRNFEFASGATLDNSSASAATVIVAQGQAPTLESPTTGGGSITLQNRLTITLTITLNTGDTPAASVIVIRSDGTPAVLNYAANSTGAYSYTYDYPSGETPDLVIRVGQPGFVVAERVVSNAETDISFVIDLAQKVTLDGPQYTAVLSSGVTVIVDTANLVGPTANNHRIRLNGSFNARILSNELEALKSTESGLGAWDLFGSDFAVSPTGGETFSIPTSVTVERLSGGTSSTVRGFLARTDGSNPVSETNGPVSFATVEGLAPQEIRDAMKLSPTIGNTESGSIDNLLSEIRGFGFDVGSDSLSAIREQGDAAWITATGFLTPATYTASLPANFGSLGINANGHISRVTLVDTTTTTTTNTDMRGTDGAVTSIGNVTVGGYATGQSPADLVTGFATPANVTDAQNAILTQGNSAWVTADVSGLLTTAGYTASLPTNFADLSISAITGLVTTSNPGGGATAAEVWGYAGRTLDGAQASALVDILEDTSTTIPGLIAALPTVAQVEAAGFTTTRHNALISAESAALAVADGRHAINYSASTATQYNTDGTSRTVFDLYDADGNLATSPETAVERRPRA